MPKQPGTTAGRPRRGSGLRAVRSSPADGRGRTAGDDGGQSTVAVEEPACRTVLLRVRGRLDDTAAVELDDILSARLAAPAVYRVLIDLVGVCRSTDAGVMALHHAQRECRLKGLRLVLIGTGNPAVHRLLYLSGLLPLVDSRPTVQAALSPHPPTPAGGNERRGPRRGARSSPEDEPRLRDGL